MGRGPDRRHTGCGKLDIDFVIPGDNDHPLRGQFVGARLALAADLFCDLLKLRAPFLRRQRFAGIEQGAGRAGTAVSPLENISGAYFVGVEIEVIMVATARKDFTWGFYKL